jgi:G:T-mismatch repair DNA endonuclease (very short patch repair protein)
MPGQRSERMSRVRSRDTKPEMLVRRLAHGMGYPYSRHRCWLSGAPDLFSPARKKANRRARLFLAPAPRPGVSADEPT